MSKKEWKMGQIFIAFSEYLNFITLLATIQPLNTQYMRNPDMVYILKMEYVSKIIFLA